MKRIGLFGLFLTIFLLSGCKSKEEKAAEFIRAELNKTLYDFDSYQPIETIVTEAKQTAYNDTACWNKAALLAISFKSSKEALKKYNDASESRDLWGRPTAYSSTYSDNKYYQYKAEADEQLNNAQMYFDMCKQFAAELTQDISKLDTTKVIGWNVVHRFRCKTKGGNSTIGEYRYVLDKNFTEVLLREDQDDDDYKLIREAIESVLDGTWNKL